MKSDPRTTSICPKCGRLLPPEEPRGLCSFCLLATMLADGPMKGGAQSVAVAMTLPRRFGEFELLKEVARGGMGIVYQARQIHINRLVAVKVLVAGVFAAPDFVARFRTEAEAEASLHHPNIVPIYEVGECEGQPFFSMRFLEGGSLAQRISNLKSSQISNQAAVELLCKLARAVHFAHQRGILHRDIKPGNVLLDDKGEPHLTDFGLAKLVENESTLTRTTAMLGTPSYMAPEQARGEARQLTTAVDVYGLGAVFYELLTGQPPFDGGTTMETIRLVLEKEPRRPTVIKPTIDRDLETICLKCLEKNPVQRYASAEALAEDLERWQRHEPVSARPPSAVYVLKKMVRRNKGGTAALGAIVLLLVAGAVFGWREAGVQRALRGKAETNERTAQEARREAGALQKKAEAEKQRAEDQLARAEWLVYASKLMLAQNDFEAGNGGLAAHYLSECQEKFRGWEWRYLSNRISSKLTLTGHTAAVRGVAFSPDGKRIVTGGGGDKTVKVWDATTGVELLTIKGHKGDIYCVTFSPDGQRIVTGAGLGGQGIVPGEAKVWDVATGRQILDLKGHKYPVWSVAFSPDGSRIATAAGERTYTAGEVKVWDAATGHELLALPSNDDARCVAFSPDSRRVATGGFQGKVEVWNAETGENQLTLKGHTSVVSGVAFSPNGTRIASSSWDKTAKVRDAQTGREISTLKHDDAVASVAFSSDSRRIVTGSWDQTTKIWDAQTAEEVFTLKGHAAKLCCVAFSPGGKRIATSSEDRTAKVWDAESGQEIPTLRGHADSVSSIAFSPDSKRLVTGSMDGTAKVWDTATWREILTFGTRGYWNKVGIWSVAFSPDGRRIATGSQDKVAKVWDAKTGRPILVLDHEDAVGSVAFSPDGLRLLTGIGGRGAANNKPRDARVWDVATGEEILAIGHSCNIWSVAFSPDGKRILTGNMDGNAKVWDSRTGHELLTLKGHSSVIHSVAFSANGRFIVTGSRDRTAKVWDADTGKELRTLKGHTGWIERVAFSPDGDRIVTGSEDRTAKIWDTRSGQEVFALKGHVDKVWGIAFSPNGQQIVTGVTGSNPTKVWSTAPAP